MTLRKKLILTLTLIFFTVIANPFYIYQVTQEVKGSSLYKSKLDELFNVTGPCAETATDYPSCLSAVENLNLTLLAESKVSTSSFQVMAAAIVVMGVSKYKKLSKDFPGTILALLKAELVFTQMPGPYRFPAFSIIEIPMAKKFRTKMCQMGLHQASDPKVASKFENDPRLPEFKTLQSNFETSCAGIPPKEESPIEEES